MRDLVLAVDIGNSSCKLAIFEGDVIAQTWRLPTAALNRQIQGLLEPIQQRVSATVVGSVVSSATSVCESALQELGIAPFVVTSATRLPIRNEYATPHTVGVDRLANAVGAYVTPGAPAIVVDVGTAVTIDVLTETNGFAGGAIWAGPDLIAAALTNNTAALPQVEIQGSVNAIAKTTEEGIRAGIVFGLAGGIERLVKEVCQQLGYTPLVVATGGGARHLKGVCSVVDQFNPDLTLVGLKRIFDHNSVT
ncbi:MAG: type III pantothenate kinase [Candidatus Sumerlaeaceae bacterium]